MNDIKKFLEECVFYPCSGLDGFPIKHLSSRIQRFFYVDYFTTRLSVKHSVIDPGFKGYEIHEVEELSPNDVFGMSWAEIRKKYRNTYEHLKDECADPFVALYQFKRVAGFTDEHGPELFELLFAGCEAIAAFELAFSRRGIAPQCLVNICSGIRMGGRNYSSYPDNLKLALLQNTGGIPAFLLYDRRVGDSDLDEYLSLVERYEPVDQFSYPDIGPITFASLALVS